VLPAGIPEEFAAICQRMPDGFCLKYRPALVGHGKVHFVRKGESIDVWRECFLLQTNQDAPVEDVWKDASRREQGLTTEKQPDDRGRFSDLPSELARERSYSVFAKHLKEHLYREETLTLLRCAMFGETSKANENEDEFRARLAPKLEAEWIAEREKLEKSHAAKLADAEDRISRARAKVSTQRWQFFSRLGSMLWVVTDTILSMMGKGLPGRRRSIDPALRSVATERGQQSNAKISMEAALKEKQLLEEQHQERLKSLEANYSLASLQIETRELKPQKSDIEVDKVSLVWLPWRIDANGVAAPMY